MSVDRLHRGPHSDIRARIEAAADPKLQEALRKGDVNEIRAALPAGITLREIEEYLRFQSVDLEYGIVKNHLIKADEGSIPAPSYEKDFLPMDSQHALDAGDLQMIGMSKMAMSSAGKGADTDSEGSSAADIFYQMGEEQIAMTEAELAEYTEFEKKIEDHLFDVQLNNQLIAKRDELRNELRRIINLMKQGIVQPEFVLIAMAKAQIGERGMMFTQTGKRIMRINEEMSALAQEIGKKDDLGGIEVTKEKMRTKATDMQMLVGNMQKLTQGINSIFDQTKSSLDVISNTKLEIIRHTAPQG